MFIQWSHCAFYRAKNTSARIMNMLGRGLREKAKGQPIDELRNLLRSIGPECEEIYNELVQHTDATASRLEQLAARLRAQLEQAEAKKPASLDELERLLYRPVCFSQVMSAELEDVISARNDRCPSNSFSTDEVKKQPWEAELCGLALSGGGIRSATFNLGLLQSLAKYKVLRRIDYLSMAWSCGRDSKVLYRFWRSYRHQC